MKFVLIFTKHISACKKRGKLTIFTEAIFQQYYSIGQPFNLMQISLICIYSMYILKHFYFANALSYACLLGSRCNKNSNFSTNCNTALQSKLQKYCYACYYLCHKIYKAVFQHLQNFKFPFKCLIFTRQYTSTTFLLLISQNSTTEIMLKDNVTNHILRSNPPLYQQHTVQLILV